MYVLLLLQIGRLEQVMAWCLAEGFAKGRLRQCQVLGLPHTPAMALDLAQHGFKRGFLPLVPLQDFGRWLR